MENENEATKETAPETEIRTILENEEKELFSAVRVGEINRVYLPESGKTEVPQMNLPERFDMRETGLLSPVRDQGELGSCWTFASLAVVEANVARNGGFAQDYPDGLCISESEKQILLTKDVKE